MINILILIAGFAFLLKGADYMIDGAVSLARRFNISDLLVGLTIIAFGTSTPELIINVIASINGTTDIAVGNVLGSNIANLLLVLGITALINPIIVKHDIVWKEIPISIMTVILFGILVNDNWIDGVSFSGLSRLDGTILSLVFVGFLFYVYNVAKANRSQIVHHRPLYRPAIASLLFVVGIVGLAIGGELVIFASKIIASNLGLSHAFIGLTVVALGTSLPELVTSAVAAFKRKADIAIGNVVGSNILNISWALGLSAVIQPMPFSKIYNMDILILLLSSFLLFLWLTISRANKITSKQGAFLIFLYLVYITTIIMRE